MDDERVIQLISPPLPLMWVYSEIVICHWWSFSPATARSQSHLLCHLLDGADRWNFETQAHRGH